MAMVACMLCEPALKMLACLVVMHPDYQILMMVTSIK